MSLWCFRIIFPHVQIKRLSTGQVESTLVRGGQYSELFCSLLKQCHHFLRFLPLTELTFWGLYSLYSILTSFCNRMKVIVILSSFIFTFLTLLASSLLDSTAHFSFSERFRSLVKVQNQIRRNRVIIYVYLWGRVPSRTISMKLVIQKDVCLAIWT